MEQIVKAFLEDAINRSVMVGASLHHVLEALQTVRTETLSRKQLAEGNSKLTAVNQWIAACCNRKDADVSASASLYDSYREWGGDLSKQAFGRVLSSLGFIRKTKNDGCYWYGLSVKGQSVNENVDRWIIASCELHPMARLSMRMLYENYIAWGGVVPKSAFNRALAIRGFAREGYVWRGLTTKAALMTSEQLLEQERAAFNQKVTS